MVQPVHGYRAGGDPIFMAATVVPKVGDQVLDLGAGVGSAGLCLLARCADVTVDALELQPELAQLARENGHTNGFEGRFFVHQGDVLQPPPDLVGRSFHWVITNPPWTQAGAVTVSPVTSRALGRVEGDADLARWLQSACRFLRPKGTLVMIHRADRADQIIAQLVQLKMGAVTLRALYPSADKPANRVIVTARKNMRSPATILPGLVIHQADGSYTPAVAALLEQAQGF